MNDGVHYFSTNSKRKAAIVERFNRTLKTTRGKDGKINGATYKGTKNLILKNGKMEYSSAKTKTRFVNELRNHSKKAYNEHKRTADSLAGEQVNISADHLNENVISNSIKD